MVAKFVVLVIRFTPTPVGNMPGQSIRVVSPPVHPHACGEYSPRRPKASSDPGSPPRLWGIWPAPRVGAATGRFTPTPVGNIRGGGSEGHAGPVHPHACGEYGLLC